MGFFSRFERKMEDGLEGTAEKVFDSPISPVQISKRAEKAMRREKMVGAGHEYAPTLYTVLVNPQDDQRLFGYYPTLAGETETYLAARATEHGLLMDGQPLVRFIVDNDLKHGKFDIIAEMVSAPIIEQLRAEEMRRYGIGNGRASGRFSAQQPTPQPQPAQPANVQWDARPQEAYRQPQPAPRAPEPQWDAQPSEAYRRMEQEESRPVAAKAAPDEARPQVESAYPAGEGYDTYGSAAFSPRPTGARPPQNTPAPQPSWEAPEPASQPEPEAEQPRKVKHELPYVPEDEIDRSLDYGEYTFNSQDFQEGRYDAAPEPRREEHDFTQAPARPAKNAGRSVLVGLEDNTRYKLDAPIVAIGRGTENNIVVNDLNASRRHAELRYEDDGTWTIIDLNSTNGTMVNGRRVGSARLRNGDRITIGVVDYLLMGE